MKLYTVIYETPGGRAAQQETVGVDPAIYNNDADDADSITSHSVVPIYRDIEVAQAHADYQNRKYAGVHHRVIEVTLIWGAEVQ